MASVRTLPTPKQFCQTDADMASRSETHRYIVYCLENSFLNIFHNNFQKKLEIHQSSFSIYQNNPSSIQLECDIVISKIFPIA